MKMSWIVRSVFIFALLVFPSLVRAAPQGASVWERAAAGVTPGISFVTLEGYNSGITTSAEPLWDESTAYTVLNTAMSSPYCVSTDANDTSAGTGARTIQVKGINSSYAAFTETLTMNGTSAVSLTNSTAQLINSVEVLTAGSGGFNAGNIRCGTGTVTGGAPAVTHSFVGIGMNKSQASWYGVPANKTMICRDLSLASYGVTAAQTVQLFSDKYVNNGILKRSRLVALNQGGSSSVVLPGLLSYEEKTIVVFRAFSAASTGPVTFFANCLLIDKALSNPNQVEF